MLIENYLPLNNISPSILFIPAIKGTKVAILVKILGWAGKNLSQTASLSIDGRNLR